MVGATYSCNLHPKLFLPLLNSLELLCCNNSFVSKNTSINGPKSSSPKLLLEPFCGALQFLIRELHRSTRGILKKSILSRQTPKLGAISTTPPPQTSLHHDQTQDGAYNKHKNNPCVQPPTIVLSNAQRRSRRVLHYGATNLDI